MDAITTYFTFLCGHVYNRDRILIAAKNDEAEGKGVDNATLFILKDTTKWESIVVKWSPVSVVSMADPMIWSMIGKDGDYIVLTSGGINEGRIDDHGQNPLRRGPLRQARAIDRSLFAVGMGRQVYRQAGSEWLTWERGLPRIRKAEIVGFNGIAGYTVSDVWAVGWGGEIWHNNAGEWAQVNSPTNVALFDVICAGPKTLFACGKLGTILKGDETGWELVEYQGPKPEFRSMAWFNERLYLADGHALYRLEDDVLYQVDFGVGESVPSSHVHCQQGVLLSIAGKEAFTTTDGVNWSALPV